MTIWSTSIRTWIFIIIGDIMRINTKSFFLCSYKFADWFAVFIYVSIDYISSQLYIWNTSLVLFIFFSSSSSYVTLAFFVKEWCSSLPFRIYSEYFHVILLSNHSNSFKVFWVVSFLLGYFPVQYVYQWVWDLLSIRLLTIHCNILTLIVFGIIYS